MKALHLVLLLTFPLCVTAGQTTYLCTTQQILELSDSGLMQKHVGMYSQIIGKQFSINRATGEMIGLPFSTDSYRQITVLNKGSKENAFKAIVTSHPPNLWVMYVYVEEFHLGTRKPFWGTEGGGNVFSGFCE